MDQELRNHRQAQLDFLSKTITGQESIRRAYHACRPLGATPHDGSVSISQMIEFILDAEFPHQAGRE